MRTELLFTVGESMLVHPMIGEVHYFNALQDTPSERLEAWRAATCFDPAAWVWNLAQPRIEFRHLCKTGNYWGAFVKNKRLLHSKHGLAIQFQYIATLPLDSDFFKRALAQLKTYWEFLEVLLGCIVKFKSK